MKTTDAPYANPVVVLREEFDDWAMLYNPDTGGALGINPVGVTIWKLIDGQRTVADIVRNIENSFDDVPESVEEDTFEFLERLSTSAFIGFPYEEKV